MSQGLPVNWHGEKLTDPRILGERCCCAWIVSDLAEVYDRYWLPANWTFSELAP